MALTLLNCYDLQEKYEDENSLLQGAFDLIDEFVEAFGKNANKNIMIISDKISFLELLGDDASEYQIALEFYDSALNIHSRFLGDDNKSYANILLKKAIFIFENRCCIFLPESGKKELIESFNKCLEIFYDDEENNKEEIQQAHKGLALLAPTTSYVDNVKNVRMHGRKAIKLEKELYGEMRRNGQIGADNFSLLRILGFSMINFPQRLKQNDYDEATGYFLEASAIADFHPHVSLYETATVYYHLGLCELLKEGKRNLREALDYAEKGLSILSKMDETEFEVEETSKKEEIDLVETLSKLIIQEMMI